MAHPTIHPSLNYMRRICLATLLGLLAMIDSSRVSSQGGQTIGNYQLVSQQPQKNNSSLFTYRATLTNNAGPLATATATARSMSSQVKLVDPTLAFGAVGSGGSVVSSDTFSFTRNNNSKFDWSSITWTITPTPDHAPVANAGPDLTPQLGQTVQLDGSASTDQDGNALTYAWSFVSLPVGSQATLSSPSAVKPTFVVDFPGSYVAQLVVNDGFLNSVADTVTVATLNSAPVANAGPDQTVLVGQTVTLNGSASSDVDGNPLTFAWTVASRPAGSAATLTNPTSVMPTFVVDKAGTYSVRLIVNDGFTNSAPDTVAITTTNSPPVANAGPDQTVFVTNTVTLDGGGSTDVDGNPLTYAWSLTSVPPGSAAALSNATAVRPTFVADKAGEYVAQLVVNDGTVPSVPDTVSITTQNTAPVANAGPDQTVSPLHLVLLDGTTSSDVDGDPLTFNWSITSKPSGSTAALFGPTTAGPSFTVDKPGLYVVQLIVNDGHINSAPDTIIVTTTNSAPTANAGPDQIGVLAGSNATLDGSQSSDPDGQPLTYSWSLTSRPATSNATLSDASSALATLPIDVAGDYVAQLIVNDGFTNSAPDTVVVQANSAPIANAGPDQQVTVGHTVQLDGSGSNDPDGNPITYLWQLLSAPAGSVATLQAGTTISPAFVADVTGAYSVQLTVTDSFGASAIDVVVVTASAIASVPPSVTLQPTDLSVSAGTLATFTAAATGIPAPTVQWQVSTNGGTTFTDVGGATSTTLSVTTTPADDDKRFHAVFSNAAGSATTSAAKLTVIVNTDGEPVQVTDAVFVNAAPLLLPLTDRSVDAETNVHFTAVAVDPGDADLYSLIGAPSGATIDPATGVFSWMPTQAQAPGSYPFFVGALDSGGLTAQQPITITVRPFIHPVDESITVSDTVEVVAIPIVTLTAIDPDASEAGPDPGVMRFTRVGDPSAALSVTYAISGTATNGADYATLSGTIAFSPGESFVDLTIAPVDDSLVETPETVVVTLVDGVDYDLGATATATVTIADNDAPLPTVSVVATDAAASEAGSDPGVFTFTRTGATTAPLQVFFGVGGTATNGVDYSGVAGNVTIPAGQASATVTVTPIDDTLQEPSETVILTIAANNSYAIGAASTATVTIADNDVAVVSVAALDPNASEVGPDPGTFRFSRVGDPTSGLTVSYTVGGTATNGTDYSSIAGSIAFPPGQSTADLVITPINDAIAEGPETVVITLTDGVDYDLGAQTMATVTIADNLPQVVTVTASDPNASEVGPDTGTFKLTRTGDTTFGLTVNYTITGTAVNGTDYLSVGPSISFAPGQSTADLTITPINDALVEGSETVVITLSNGSNYTLGTQTTATITIADNATPLVSVTALDPNASEIGADPGTFRFSRVGDTTFGLPITFTISGTATNGVDYSTINPTIFFAAGQATVDVNVTPINDGQVEGPETVQITVVDGAQYDLGAQSTATVTIADNPAPLVTVTAPDPNASEVGPDVGVFRFTRTGDTTFGLTVSYAIGGTATNGTDYQATAASILIPAGLASADLTITPIADTAPEGAETVSLTLTDGPDYDLGAQTTATVTIADSSPVVDVVATDPDADENGPNTGTFTFTRHGGTGDLSAPLTVNFTRSGSATAGSDYLDFPLTVTIPGGQAAAAVTVTPIADGLIEGNETVILSLAAGPYNLGTPASATVTIADSNVPIVTVTASDATASEVGLDPGTFTITRAGETTSALVVSYTMGGTATFGADYQSIPLSLTIPAGQASATVTITPVNDALVEGSETVVLTLVDGSNYHLGAQTSATVTIADNPTPVVTIAATDATASEVGPDPGLFTITRVGDTTFPLTVSYTVGGTATLGADYQSIASSLTIPATQTSATVTITPVNDTLVEGSETVVLTLVDGANYDLGAQTTATVTIADNTTPIVTIAATDPNAWEVGPDPGAFTITRTGDTTSGLTVSYTIGGTATIGADYQSIPSSVTIPAGKTSVTITITPVNDALVEGSETVVLTLQDGANYDLGVQISATVTIADNPTPVVTITATDATASEVGLDPGLFTITRAGDTTFALTVSYTVGGTATIGADYQSIPSSVTIPAGQTSVAITITPVNDALVEGSETVVLTLQDGANYDLGAQIAATVTIADNATPVVTIAATDATASEVGPDPGTFTITRTGDLTFALTVSYTIGGTAINGSDYLGIAGSVTIPAAQASTTVTITPRNDGLVEGTETVVLTLQDGTNYDLGAQTAATVTIADNPTPIVTIAATDDTASEVGLDPGTFTITRTGDLTFAMTVSYTIGGTAINGSDYLGIAGSVTIPALQASATVTITPRNDALVEGSETVVLTLQDGANYDLGAQTAATVTIADNPAPIVTIAATDAAASETGPDPGTFTITRVGDLTFALTVSYTIGGTATNGADYQGISASVTIPAGQASATVTITPINDAVVEGSETVVLTLTDGANYDLGAQTTATVTIADND